MDGYITDFIHSPLEEYGEIDIIHYQHFTVHFPLIKLVQISRYRESLNKSKYETVLYKKENIIIA